MYGATRAELKLEGTIRGACNGALKSKQFFPKAAAKGSFKKRAVFKDCHQTSPKVLLK